MIHRQLHRQVAGSRIRNRVHKEQLVSSHPEDASYERLALVHLCFGELVYYVVQLYPLLCDSLDHSRDVRPVLFAHELVGAECRSKCYI